jgi:large subunit ribosomal protein L24
MNRTVMHVKRNDLVQVITGKEKGKIGKILRVIQKTQRVVVEKVNIVKKHQKPTGKDGGGIIEKESSIHASNVLLYVDSRKNSRKSFTSFGT